LNAKENMKRKIILAALLCSSSFLFAQLELPQPSPKAFVSQVAGITEISVDYSSPAIRNRNVWSEVVPLNALWRTGANSPTTVKFTKDVNIDGKNVPAGSYTLFTIPSAKNWTVILNKDLKASTDKYNQENDLLRITVTPTKCDKRERLIFMISDFDNDKANITMEWETVRITIPVKLNTHEQATKSIESNLGNAWRNYANAARYYLDNDKDLDKALVLIDQSITFSEGWYNNWIKAQILAKKGNYAEALVFAKKAKTLGDENPAGFFYKKDVETAIAEWSKK